MKKAIPTPKAGNLADLRDDRWFSERNESSIWIRIFTSLFIPHEKFFEAIGELIPDLDGEPKLFLLDPPVLLGVGTIEKMKVPETNPQVYSSPTGQLIINLKVEDRELPQTTYTFLSTPHRIDGQPGDESRSRRALDRAAALITLHTGLNFMCHGVFEGEVQLKDGTFTNPGKPIRIPKPSEGPFLGAQNGLDIAEIAKRVGALRKPKQDRISLSLRLMNEAMRKYDGFFEYWTALEVVCDGKANRIKKKLAEIYGIASHKEAGEATRLSLLAEWRHDYVHRGKRPNLTHDVERYIQLLFLDLLRAEIDLPPRNHLPSLQRAPGYDLSPIGLPDNRTEDQKNAASKARRNSVRTPSPNHPESDDE